MTAYDRLMSEDRARVAAQRSLPLPRPTQRTSRWRRWRLAPGEHVVAIRDGGTTMWALDIERRLPSGRTSTLWRRLTREQVLDLLVGRLPHHAARARIAEGC